VEEDSGCVHVLNDSNREGSIEEAATGGLAFWLTGFGRQLRVFVIGANDVGKSVIIRRLIGQELIADTAELTESTSYQSLRGLLLTPFRRC